MMNSSVYRSLVEKSQKVKVLLVVVVKKGENHSGDCCKEKVEIIVMNH